MPPIEEKLYLLDVVCRVFDRFVADRYPHMACDKACPACCTRHVTGTALEAYRLRQALRQAGREDLIAALPQLAAADLFRPRVTTNSLAMACIQRQEPPEETPGQDDGPCLLLEGGLCTAYDDRPFGCRGMMSLNRCEPGGEGELPPELVSLVTVCFQFIEHLDAGGVFGNINDLLLKLLDDQTAFTYATGGRLQFKGLAPNKPVPGLLVPPEQQETVQAFLDRLFQTDCQGQSFRERMAAVRDQPF